MKKLMFILLAAAGIAITSAQSQTLTGTVGTGPDASYLVIEAYAFGSPLTFEYLYTYNPADPFDSYTLLTAIDAAADDLAFTFTNFGTPEAPNYFLDSVTWMGVTLTNTPAPTFSPYWAQWVSGGQSGFPEAEPIDSGTWVFGTGFSAPYRLVEPGSSDGVIFNDGLSAPSTAPVPEPASVGLIIMAAVAFVSRRKRHARAGV